MKHFRILTFLVAALPAALLSACGSTSEAYVQGSPLPGAEFDNLWDRATEVLLAQGYRSDPQLTRRARREIVTHWQEHLAPSRFEGKRRRAHVRFVETSPGTWRTDVWLEQERNTEIAEPLNPFAADWEIDPEADDARGTVLQYRIERLFLPTELEESPRNR